MTKTPGFDGLPYKTAISGPGLAGALNTMSLGSLMTLSPVPWALVPAAVPATSASTRQIRFIRMVFSLFADH